MINQCLKCIFFDEEFDRLHQNDFIKEDEEKEVHYCPAFPDGIPDPIWKGDKSHTEPYDGDNGIQFMEK
jgi:hypothetical protein